MHWRIRLYLASELVLAWRQQVVCKISSNCSHSLKPGCFQLSGIETRPPNLQIIELATTENFLIPLTCFSNCWNVFFCDNGSQDCLVEAKLYVASRWKSCVLTCWLLLMFGSLWWSAGLTFFCLQLKVWSSAWYYTIWLDMALIFMTCIQWLFLEQPVKCVSKPQIKGERSLCVFVLFFQACVYSHLQEKYGAIKVIKLRLLELRKYPHSLLTSLNKRLSP